MTSPRTVDDVDVSVDALYRADESKVASIHSKFPSAHAFFLTVDALDAREAAVLGHDNGRLGRAHRADGYFTRNDVGKLQSPCPILVVARTLNSKVVPAGSPVIVVFACNVLGASTHVLPPSMLACQSYDARAAATFFTASEVLVMIDSA